jgi:hypothetical protein
MRFSNPVFPLTILAVTWLAVAMPAARANAGDWISAPSFYSHNPATGTRVHQYSPIGPFYTYPRGDFRRSGRRQTRSSIQVGGISDHLHVVEEWGAPVRPYGEWRFPYRPHSVPYDLWGAPVPQVYAPQHFGNGRRPPPFAGRGPNANAGFNPPAAGTGPPASAPSRRAQPYPGYRPQPWDDGRYPPYDAEGPYGYPDLLQRGGAPVS